MEEALGDIPCPTAFVRAGAFIDNNVGAPERASSTGWFDSFLRPTDRTFPMIAAVDIGREVARLLVGGRSGEKVVELGSPVSPDELARAMGEVLGRPIPRERWTATLEAMGPWEEMQDGFNSGWIDFGVPGTEPVAGTATPAEVFARAREA